ncbi:hypothetical protein NLG97_g9634 [Lecanicillium saksenae]|uniref:Uncharacterized protein n=1 Tax=Lecanicillium saksenae TaxID=468837 RepID=A0ACC1QFF0_9HYPO|nr:hypothetical protein NLG97_g9634 [Lecanicillium saksenae]
MQGQNARQERNDEVDRWLHKDLHDITAPTEKTAEEIQALNQPRDDDDGIPLGNNTENRHVAGQIYINPNGGALNDEDFKIIHSANRWESGPMSHRITSEEQGRFQPESSQAAIERFERLIRDNESILSRSATWGTRRRSFPNEMETESIIGGNFFSRLAISKPEPKKPKPTGFLAELRGLVRRTSNASIRKRSRSRSKSAQGDDLYRPDSQESGERRDSSPHLSPTSRTSSWGKQAKQPTPSINSVFATMATPLASIGSTHARSGSISGITPMASPKSPFSLAVAKVLSRPRSKSELPKTTPLTVATDDPLPSPLDIWKKTSSVPSVAPTSKPVSNAGAHDADDDDDDDDELAEDLAMKKNPNEIDSIPHTYAGFQEHALKLNPGLENGGLYLVDRIAHQQVVRYKLLLNLKVNHMRQGANCSCGSLCMALGGSARILGDPKGEKSIDPLAARFDGDDSPVEGIISNESFPPDIPMPPSQYLPAEFECQLCYQKKKFQKPSDWTKHVHEDVGPFTCTWDKCKDPKTFKRKADWVRHENEGHRHLEWWTCDVDDCRHTCYRKDNFLQHLVREHKFVEPKVKTKAAMKRAGGVEPTWAKVEECHMETQKRPQDEPCKFCGRVFPTWKKLTVHLAKHMEQIALPVLRLVEMKAKELGADSIISPVQDPPVRQMLPVPSDPQGMGGMAFGNQLHPNHAQMSYGQNMGTFGYGMGQGNSQFYQAQYGSMGQTMQTSMADMSNGLNGMANTMDMSGFNGMNDMTGLNGYNGDRSMHNMGASTGQFGQADQSYMNLDGNLNGGLDGNLSSNLNSNGLEQFPTLDGLAVQGMQGDIGGQMMYENGMMQQQQQQQQQRASANASPFSGHETLSTYSHSPHMQATNQEHTTWDNQGMFP